MIEVGFDVVLLAVLGLAGLMFAVIYCEYLGMSEDEAEAAISVSSCVVMIMIVGYLLVSRLIGLIVM